MEKYIILLLLLPSIVFAVPRHLINFSGKNYTSDANCVGAWGMTSNAGNETDLSGENETLTQSGTIPTSADVPTGYSGTSRDFELSETDFLYHADGGSTEINGADQPLTLSAWVKPEAATNLYAYAIIAKTDLNALRGYHLYLNGTGVNTFSVSFRVSADGGTTNSGIVTSTTTNYATGVWHHVAAVYNDTDVRVYVDGVLACTPVAYTLGIYNTTAPFAVGAWYSSGTAESHFDGLIDDAAVFNRALSAGEIYAIYSNGMTGGTGE